MDPAQKGRKIMTAFNMILWNLYLRRRILQVWFFIPTPELSYLTKPYQGDLQEAQNIVFLLLSISLFKVQLQRSIAHSFLRNAHSNRSEIQ